MEARTAWSPVVKPEHPVHLEGTTDGLLALLPGGDPQTPVYLAP